ncbi:Ribonuclease P Rpp40 [Trinorchestia longiramus]|nr:Ribonuclease P Rpp40 [Trinorchestia longiramus]
MLSLGKIQNESSIYIQEKYSDSDGTTGEVQCISEGTLLGSNDCAALYPSGRLSLLLSHHTYHALGLEGAPVANILRKPYHRYAVHVNSLSPGFHPARRGYERTLSCLQKLRMDFRVVWEPSSSSVCSSSVAKYFSDLGYGVEPLGLPAVEQSLLQDVEVPLVTWRGSACLQQQQLALGGDGANVEGKTREVNHQQDALDFLESVGCLLFNVKPVSAGRSSGHASTVAALHCDGFFSSAALQGAVATARSWLLGPASQSPWVCLSFHCHPEVPFEQRGSGRCSKTQGRHCGSVSCGCSVVETDQHCPGGRLLMIVLMPSGDDCWFQCGSAGVRHRYFPKTSNNK